MSTETTTPTDAEAFDSQLAAAEANAHAAMDKLSRLRDQQRAAEDDADRALAADRYEFETERARAHQSTWRPRMREAQEAFDRAVADGGDAIGAWTRVLAVNSAAVRDAQISDHSLYMVAEKRYNDVRAVVEATNPRLAYIRQLLDQTRTNRSPSAHERAAGALAELADLNRQLNDWGRENGLPVHRTDDDTADLSVTGLGVTKPYSRMVGDLETRTFDVALRQAMLRAAEHAATQQAQAHEREFAAWRAGKQRTR